MWRVTESSSVERRREGRRRRRRKRTLSQALQREEGFWEYLIILNIQYIKHNTNTPSERTEYEH